MSNQVFSSQRRISRYPCRKPSQRSFSVCLTK
nr:MAG TPA: hypothetical protein [Caudoviricetes sp.]